MVGRPYKVMFEKVSVSAVQDLFQIIGAAGKMLLIEAVKIKCVDTTAPTNQQLALRGSYLPVTVTNGSGGSSPTPTPIDPGDSAASFTAKANNTVQATTSGTKVTKAQNGENVYSGWDERFEEPFPVGPSESFVFELITTPGTTITLSGEVRVREIGG